MSHLARGAVPLHGWLQKANPGREEKFDSSKQRKHGRESGNRSGEMSVQSWDQRVISHEVFLTGSAGYLLAGPS